MEPCLPTVYVEEETAVRQPQLVSSTKVVLSRFPASLSLSLSSHRWLLHDRQVRFPR